MNRMSLLVLAFLRNPSRLYGSTVASIEISSTFNPQRILQRQDILIDTHGFIKTHISELIGFI